MSVRDFRALVELLKCHLSPIQLVHVDIVYLGTGLMFSMHANGATPDVFPFFKGRLEFQHVGEPVLLSHGS